MSVQLVKSTMEINAPKFAPLHIISYHIIS